MSIYDTIQKISDLTDVKHYVPPDKIIARFHIKDKVINYHFSEYNKSIFTKHLGFSYDKIEISYHFWDPTICKSEMLMVEDIEYFETLDVFNGEVTWNAAAGFVISLISIYNVIAQSYNSTNFDYVTRNINFDKQIISKVFKHVDIVIDMPDGLLQFVKNIYKDNIMDIMITPSGYLRFTPDNLGAITEGTILVHEIASIIDKHVFEEATKLEYYIELLQGCGEIQHPHQLCNILDENIMLKICKLKFDIEGYYKMIEKAVSLYYDRGGKLATIAFTVDPMSYPNFKIILQTFKNFRSISSQDRS